MLTEGTYPCTVISAAFGDNDKGVPCVQINIQFDGGPNAGKTTTYEDRVDAKSALYVGRSCKAVGWNGDDLRTLAADCAAWIIKTGGKSTAEIKHIPYRDKKTGEEKIWDKCNAIGRGSRPLVTPRAANVADANEAMKRAMGEDAETATDDKLPF